MATIKNVATTVGTLVLAFFLAVNISTAQEQTIKTADATETVSSAKEVKPVTVVPAKLAKAMDEAKTKGKKETGKRVSKAGVKSQETITYFYTGPASPLNSNVVVPGNWNTNQGSFSCDHDTEIPCSIEVPEDMTVSEYLESLDNDPETIINASTLGRN